MLEARTQESLPPANDITEIAFAGRSNVGKSSFLNALAQRKGLARTSSTPGCTRGLILFELVTGNGTKLRFMDLPGYGFASRARDERVGWGAMIEQYLKERSALRAVAVLVDARRGPEEEEEQMLEFLSAVEVPWVLIATKLDKLAKHERSVALSAMKKKYDCPVVGVSATENLGRDEAMKTLLMVSGCDAEA